MKQKSVRKIILYAIIGGALVAAHIATAVTQYPPASLLQTGDITTVHIRDGTILNADISGSAAIDATKIRGGVPAGGILLANGTQIATSSLLVYATSTNRLGVGTSTPGAMFAVHGAALIAGNLTAANLTATGTTNFGDVAYTWPGADGSVNQVLSTNGSATLSWATSGGTFLTTTATAGEPLVLGNAVFIASSTQPTDFAAQCETDSSTQDFAQDGSNEKQGQNFTNSTDKSVKFITLHLKKYASPTDNVVVSIQSDTAGLPSGTMLASTTIAASSLTTTVTAYTLQLTTPYTTVGGTQYWLVLERSGAIDATNYYGAGRVDGSNCGSFTFARFLNSVWTSVATRALYLDLFRPYTAGDVYLTSAGTFDDQDAFIGIANGTFAASSTATIFTHGTITGLSGYAAGNKYYLSNTRGTTAITAGTTSHKVGIGLSATSLLLQNIW